MKNQSQEYFTPIQLKMPVDMERMIEVDDPVYSFNEVLCHIDLNQYFVEEKDHKTGRPRYDGGKLLKVILFAFVKKVMKGCGKWRSCAKRISVFYGCWTEKRHPVI